MDYLNIKKAIEYLHPEFSTKPRVWYKNLYRYRDCFIAGSVSAETHDIVDCVEGARVSLKKDGEEIAAEITDIYGDFKFDRLAENSGDYTIEISADGRTTEIVNVGLGQSKSLEDIRLT